MTRNLLEKVDLDNVLSNFNIRGRYHAVTAVWLTLGITLDCMWYCDYVLIAEEIKYSCANDNNLTYNNGNERVYFSNDQNYRNTTVEKCHDSVPCTQWIYENPDSFVAEFQLACQDWKRTLVGTVNVFGYMVGIIIVGSLSDRLGRKTMVITTGVTGALCGLAKSFAGYYWIYILIEFLEASLDPFSPIIVLGLEMVATESRATYTGTISTGLAIGGVIFPLVKWLVPYWRTCLRIIYAPGLVFILFIYLIDESPRWLLTKGRIDQVVKNLETAAKSNKMDLEENLTMLSYEEEMSADFKTVIIQTFKSRRLLHRFFVCNIWWILGIFVGHGLTVNSVFLEGNKYINFALGFLMRLPSSLLAGQILNKFKRRGPLMMCFLVCALICVSHPFIPKNMIWLIVLTYMFGKLSIGMAYTILYIYTSELFPTYTRNSMQALCSSLGRIGGIVATQMPLLFAYWSGLPTVLYGATSLVAGLATLLVPDTAQSWLPDTVHQAEALETIEAKKSEATKKRGAELT